MLGNESPIFARSYELLRWLLPLTLKFPRQQRFVLAQMLQRSALTLHERLIEAAHGNGDEGAYKGKARGALAALARADVELDKLRHYLRLCHDLLLVSDGQYEYAATRLEEIGRLLGGWRRSIERRAGSSAHASYAKKSGQSGRGRQAGDAARTPGAQKSLIEVRAGEQAL